MCRDDDNKESEHVLQHPTVAEFRSGNRAAHVKRFVVDVEQGHYAQGDQRQGQLAAENVVQLIDRLSRQPMSDPEHLDDRLQRTAARVLQNGRMSGTARFVAVLQIRDFTLLRRDRKAVVDVVTHAAGAVVAVVVSPISAESLQPRHESTLGRRLHRRRPSRRPQRHRIPVADHDVRPHGRQLVVDVLELQVHGVAQQREVRLHAAHAPVLQVNVEEEQQQHGVTVLLVPVQQVQPQEVHGHHEYQAHGDHGRREHPETTLVPHGQRPVVLVPVLLAFVVGQVPADLVHDHHPRNETGARHQPRVQPTVRGGQRVLAPSVHHAHAPRSDQDVQDARRQHHGRKPLFESVVRQVYQEHAAHLPEVGDWPHQYAVVYVRHRVRRQTHCL